MTTHDSATVDFTTIKARQQIAWSAGDYSIIGATLVVVSENLCETVNLHAGQRVLDVATGSGITALAAARCFCEVSAIDYVPSLLERGESEPLLSGCRSPFSKLTLSSSPLQRPPSMSSSRHLEPCLLPTRNKWRENCCASVAPVARLAWRTGRPPALSATSSALLASMPLLPLV